MTLKRHGGEPSQRASDHTDLTADLGTEAPVPAESPEALSKRLAEEYDAALERAMAAPGGFKADETGKIELLPEDAARIQALREKIAGGSIVEEAPSESQPAAQEVAPTDLERQIVDLRAQIGKLEKRSSLIAGTIEPGEKTDAAPEDVEFLGRLEVSRRETMAELAELVNTLGRDSDPDTTSPLESAKAKLFRHEYEIYRLANMRASTTQDIQDLQEFMRLRHAELSARAQLAHDNLGELVTLAVRVKAIEKAAAEIFTHPRIPREGRRPEMRQQAGGQQAENENSGRPSEGWFRKKLKAAKEALFGPSDE